MIAGVLDTETTARGDLSRDERQILDETDRYARGELYPLAARMDHEEWWPDDLFERLGEAGYLGVAIPESDGGVGGDLFASGLVLQAISRWNHAVALSWVAHDNLCLDNLYRNGNEDQRRRFVPALCSGRCIGALALTEPGAGSDAIGSMRTTARRDGDHYVLNGTKLYITNGPIADVVIVYALLEPADGERSTRPQADSRQRKVAAFIVERRSPGFAVAQKLSKMGFRGSPTAELVFENCRVPIHNLLGGESGGLAVLMGGLDIERAMISPICLGISERALALSVDYARTRQQFGRPIGNFQMVRAKLADMYVWVETMRSFTYRVLREAAGVETGRAGRGEIHKLTAASVMYAAETMNKVLNEAVQIHGGSGYIWETEINRLFRATKLLEIGAGTTEVRKLIISEELLR
jgi:isovaleryl-CoA dehydrogenase